MCKQLHQQKEKMQLIEKVLAWWHFCKKVVKVPENLKNIKCGVVENELNHLRKALWKKSSSNCKSIVIPMIG